MLSIEGRLTEAENCPQSFSGCSQQVLVLGLLLLLLCEHWHLLLVGRHLAGLVEDDEEDQDEDTNHWVTNDGHDGPHRQAHPQLMLHGSTVLKPPDSSDFRGGLQVCCSGQSCHFNFTDPEKRWQDCSMTSTNIATALTHMHTLVDMPPVNLPVIWWGRLSKDYFLSDKVLSGTKLVLSPQMLYKEEPAYVQDVHDAFKFFFIAAAVSNRETLQGVIIKPNKRVLLYFSNTHCRKNGRSRQIHF